MHDCVAHQAFLIRTLSQRLDTCIERKIDKKDYFEKVVSLETSVQNLNVLTD